MSVMMSRHSSTGAAPASRQPHGLRLHHRDHGERAPEGSGTVAATMAVPDVSGFWESHAASGTSPRGRRARRAASGTSSASVLPSPAARAVEKLDPSSFGIAPSVRLGHAALVPRSEQGGLPARGAIETNRAAHAFCREAESSEQQPVPERLDAQRRASPRVAEGVEALPDELGRGVGPPGAQAVEDLAVEDGVDLSLHRRIEGGSRILDHGQARQRDLPETLEPVSGGGGPGRSAQANEKERGEEHRNDHGAIVQWRLMFKILDRSMIKEVGPPFALAV